MNPFRKKAQEIVVQLSLEEKANLCTGGDFWHTRGIEQFGLAPANLTDGPHGLRKQNDDEQSPDKGKMVPAVCFPAACSTASSFDVSLLEKMGQAIGEEAKAEGIAVLLGPGINIKRTPLGGRNFEYFSEDPFLTGQVAAGFVRGVESCNVGTSVKHFAANNQESWRMVGDSIVDERALREIYLSAFETVVKESNPATLMCSYNQINGTYASDNGWLINDILRKEWGFEGTVITDWGATNQRIEAILAGLDLSMPGPVPAYTQELIEAVNAGKVPLETLNESATRIVEILIRNAQNKRSTFDKEKQHNLAGEIASECAVLLENDGILPLQAGKKLAVLGGFAENPRFQGGGSSHIPTTKVTSVINALDEAGISYTYSEGYSSNEIIPDKKKIEQAVQTASQADVVIICAGLPNKFESESYDRKHLNLPDSHLYLIDEVIKLKKTTVVVLMQGSPTLLPFRKKVNSILLAGLTGQNGGTAIVNLLTGKANPSGRLAETYPLSLESVVATDNFGERAVQYRESIFIGYRWFDTANIEVQYPFGYGLSYTTFSYKNLRVSKPILDNADTVSVYVDVTNTGKYAGKEVVQVYIEPPKSETYRATHELKGFEKVFLNPGETKNVCITLPLRAFQFFNNATQSWYAEPGKYTIHISRTSRDSILSASVEIKGERQVVSDFRQKAPEYFTPHLGTKFSEKSFKEIYGKPLPIEMPIRPFHRNSPIADTRQTILGKLALKLAVSKLRNSFSEIGSSDADADEIQMILDSTIFGLPFRSLVILAGGKLTFTQLDGIIDIFNGHLLKGLKKLKK